MAALATAERFYALQRFPQAMNFAQRALPKLKDGTRDWQRANDIIAASQNEMTSARQSRR
jgi:predicted Zn-dependent protease